MFQIYTYSELVWHSENIHTLVPGWGRRMSWCNFDEDALYILKILLRFHALTDERFQLCRQEKFI